MNRIYQYATNFKNKVIHLNILQDEKNVTAKKNHL